LKIYCETSCLPHNIRDEKSQGELAAIKVLAKKFDLYGSRFVRHEVLNTNNEVQRNFLIVECDSLKPVLKDEKLLGFHTNYDQFGGFVCCPMIADTHDDALCEELKKQGLEPADAQHITQAVCNDCGIFLTRDERTIIKPHGQWLETRLYPLKLLRPSQLLEALELAVPDHPGASA
jgi:predicted nucleic acid-binding protein